MVGAWRGGGTAEWSWTQYMAWVVLALGGALAITGPAWGGARFYLHPTWQATMAVLPVMAVVIRLEQRGHRPLASHFFVGAVFAVSWYAILVSWAVQPSAAMFSTLAYAFLFAVLLLPVRSTTIMLLFSLAGISLMRAFAPSGELVGAEAFIFTTTFGGLAVAGSYQRHHLALSRRREADARRQGAARLDAFMRGMKDPALLLDHDGCIIHWNPAADKAFRDAGPIRTGMPLRLLVPDRSRNRVGDAIGRALGGRPQTVPVSWSEGDRHFEFAFDQVKIGDTADGLVTTCRDVTDMTRSHRERTLAVQRARTTALNIISHQLRTPLTPAMLQTYSILQHKDSGLSDQHRHALESVYRNIQRLSRLIEALAEAGRVDHSYQEPPSVECDLADVLEAAVDELDEATKVQVIDAPATPVLADPLGIRLSLNMLMQRASTQGRTLKVWIERRHRSAIVHMEDEAGIFAGMLLDDSVLEGEHELTAEEFEDALAVYIAKGILESNGARFEHDGGVEGHARHAMVLLPAADARVQRGPIVGVSARRPIPAP